MHIVPPFNLNVYSSNDLALVVAKNGKLSETIEVSALCSNNADCAV